MSANQKVIYSNTAIAEVENDIQKNIVQIKSDTNERRAGKSYQKVLLGLLQQIKPVDFRKRAGIEDGDKISRKLYVVISIDEIVNISIANSWGLCTKNGFIYVFNSKYWQAVNADDDFKPFLADAAIKMGVPELEAKYHQFKDELYKQFLSASNLSIPETGGNILINLINGTYEISENSQTLRPPQREDFIKYQLPFEYDKNAKCPKFDKYIVRVLPDKDCRDVLSEYIGSIFAPKIKLEKSAILYGSGANGKSVLFEVVNAILGNENVCSYSLQNLTKYDSYQRAELSNKLLNYASEINGKLEASIFKQLASGEPVEARQIYGKPFIMRDYGKLMFNCNELPREVEQTDAFFRRFIIIPFNQTIPDEEQDFELSKKIIASELSGVFNWILDGLRRILVQRKFTRSDLVREQIDNFRLESDSVALFIDDAGYSTTFENYIPLKEMYAEYKGFCYDNGYKACALRTVSARLKSLKYESERKNTGYVIYAKK